MAVSEAMQSVRAPAATTAEWQPRRWPSGWTIFRHVVLALFAFIIIAPIVWVILLSVKSIQDAYRNYIWPHHFDFSHYAGALQQVVALRVSLDDSRESNGPLRGGVVAMRPLTLHASSKSIDGRPRRVLDIEYAASDAFGGTQLAVS